MRGGRSRCPERRCERGRRRLRGVEFAPLLSRPCGPGGGGGGMEREAEPRAWGRGGAAAAASGTPTVSADASGLGPFASLWRAREPLPGLARGRGAGIRGGGGADPGPNPSLSPGGRLPASGPSRSPGPLAAAGLRAACGGWWQPSARSPSPGGPVRAALTAVGVFPRVGQVVCVEFVVRFSSARHAVGYFVVLFWKRVSAGGEYQREVRE